MTKDQRPTLVTGASGFLGSHLAEAMCARRMPVRALVRPRTDAGLLEGLGVEIHRGDVRDPGDVADAMAGCGSVIHTAAVTGWVRDRKLYEAVNYEGTRNVIGAARTNSLRRIVHVSSVVTIGERRGEVATESTPHRGSFLREYERTKYLAEEKVRQAAKTGLPVTIVNPTGVIGPRNHRGMTGRTLVSYLTGKLPALPNPDGRINLVHVGDVAAGTLAAFDRGQVGERYILGGENLTIAEMFRMCEEITGVSPPSRRLPGAVAHALALASEITARFAGGEPRVTRDMLRVAEHGMLADSTRAERELDYAARPVREALEETLRWLIESGHVG